MESIIKPLLEALGGGQTAVVIIGMGWAIYHLYKRVNELTDLFVKIAQDQAEASMKIARQNGPGNQEDS